MAYNTVLDVPSSTITNLTDANSISTANLLVTTASSSTPSTSDTLTSAAVTAWSGSSITMGTAYQNTFGLDVEVLVGIAASAAVTATIVLGIGPTNNPTTTTVFPSFSVTGQISILIKLPKNYYFILNKTGTLTQTNNFIVMG